MRDHRGRLHLTESVARVLKEADTAKELAVRGSVAVGS